MPKLLLAVDSPTIRRVIELTFDASEIDVITVTDGDLALARIAAERPDVVLADIALPLRSGYDVAAFVKGDPALSHIRVVLLAGAFDPVDEAKAAAVRCDGILAKPFEPRHVLARVTELLGVESGEAAGSPVPEAAARPVPPRPLEFPRRVDGQNGQAGARSAATTPPAPPADPPAAGLSIDRELNEYFEQLDAAFDSLGADPTASGRLADSLSSLDENEQPVPTLDRLIGTDDGPAGNVPVTADTLRGTFDLLSAGDPPSGLRARPAPVRPAHAEEHHKAGTIADAFAALLAYEEGDHSVPPVRLVPEPQAPAIGEDVLEEVTRRVLARVAPAAVKDVVAEVVADVAERLVREEIERIRKDS